VNTYDGCENPLIMCHHQRNLKMMKLLLELNADPNTPDPEQQQTLLHYLAENGNSAQGDAYYALSLKPGWTAEKGNEMGINLSKYIEELENVEHLTKEEQGKYQLREKARKSDFPNSIFPFIDLAMEYGADINARDLFSYTPAMVAGRYGPRGCIIRHTYQGFDTLTKLISLGGITDYTKEQYASWGNGMMSNMAPSGKCITGCLQRVAIFKGFAQYKNSPFVQNFVVLLTSVLGNFPSPLLLTIKEYLYPPQKLMEYAGHLQVCEKSDSETRQ